MKASRSGSIVAAGSVAGAAGMVVGVALPWVRVGPRRLSGFDLVTIGRNFGNEVASGPLGRAWLALPVLAAAVVALVALGQRRAAVVLGGVVGCAVGAVAGAVWRMAGASGTIGPIVTVVAAAVSLLSVPFGLRRSSPPDPLATVKITRPA